MATHPPATAGGTDRIQVKLNDSRDKMKRCPTCNRTYTDTSLNFCLEDGTPLSTDPALNATIRYPASRDTADPPPTEIYHPPPPVVSPRQTIPPPPPPPPQPQQQWTAPLSAA